MVVIIGSYGKWLAFAKQTASYIYYIYLLLLYIYYIKSINKNFAKQMVSIC